MIHFASFEELSEWVTEQSASLPTPFHLEENKACVRPNIRTKTKVIYFSNACIAQYLIYELYYDYKKHFRKIIFYNALLSRKFSYQYLDDVHVLLDMLDKELIKIERNLPKITLDVYFKQVVYFLLGHELWHAKFKADSLLKKQKMNEVENLLKEVFADLKPHTFRQKIAFNDIDKNLLEPKHIEELACDRNSIKEFFRTSLPEGCSTLDAAKVAQQIIRSMVIRQYVSTIDLASRTEHNSVYRKQHQFDTNRTGFLTYIIAECMPNDVDESFIKLFSHETLRFKELLTISPFYWIWQLRTLNKVSSEKRIDDIDRQNRYLELFDTLQKRIIRIILEKAN